MSAKSEMLVIGNESFETRPGGLNRYLEALCAAFRESGVTPSVITSTVEDAGPMALRMLRITRRARPHLPTRLLDVHFAPSGLLVVLASRLRTPIVVHFQGPWAREAELERGKGIASPLRRVVERAVYRRASIIVTLSEAFRQLVINEYGVTPSRVVVIPPGVDLDRFHPGPPSISLGDFNVPHGEPVVVVARRLSHRMGIDTLIRAWRDVYRSTPAQLIVLGEGKERAMLERMASEHAPPGSVRFLGRVSDDILVRAYQTATVSVMPSRALEGFGLVALESLACGTPVVASDVDGLRDAIAGLDPSLLVPPDDPEALARRLVAALRGELPTASDCRAYAERFSWQTAARRHLELYDQILDD